MTNSMKEVAKQYHEMRKILFEETGYGDFVNDSVLSGRFEYSDSALSITELLQEEHADDTNTALYEVETTGGITYLFYKDTEGYIIGRHINDKDEFLDMRLMISVAELENSPLAGSLDYCKTQLEIELARAEEKKESDYIERQLEKYRNKYLQLKKHLTAVKKFHYDETKVQYRISQAERTLYFMDDPKAIRGALISLTNYLEILSNEEIEKDIQKIKELA